MTGKYVLLYILVVQRSHNGVCYRQTEMRDSFDRSSQDHAGVYCNLYDLKLIQAVKCRT